ncbi:exosortase-associated protein EpsI, B-type [Viridibacterium curvum]
MQPLRNELRRAAIALLIMLVAAAGAWAMTPRHKLVDLRGKVDVEKAIPKQFAGWQLDTRSFGGIVNPQQQETLDRLYSQLLARAYINSRGERVMLTIAYGEDQRDGMLLHYPEVCYPAQGFQVDSNTKSELLLPAGRIPVRKLETNLQSQRFEPVTYWTIIGERASVGGIDKKLVEMHYSLQGQIPDGLLFRVSSIDRDSQAAFALQAAFIKDLVAALSPRDRQLLTGL